MGRGSYFSVELPYGEGSTLRLEGRRHGGGNGGDDPYENEFERVEIDGEVVTEDFYARLETDLGSASAARFEERIASAIDEYVDDLSEWHAELDARAERD